MRLLLSALLGALIPTFAQAADSCELQRLAELPVVYSEDGIPLIHADAAGHGLTLAIRIDQVYSNIKANAAKALGLERHRLQENEPQIQYGNEDIKYTTRIPQLALGHAVLLKPEFLEIAAEHPDESKYDGFLGINDLRQFDLELDLGNNLIRLFSPNHCPGRVAYWAGEYGKLTLTQNPLHLPYVKLTLDGHDLLAVVSTSHAFTSMPKALAAKFHASPEPSSKCSKPPNAWPSFTELDIDSVVLSHPQIDTSCEHPICEDAWFQTPELALGLNHLRKLRLYFAFGDGTLYILPSGAASH